jgi:hypothetical protein
VRAVLEREQQDHGERYSTMVVLFQNNSGLRSISGVDDVLR